jgi:hypothetical protein
MSDETMTKPESNSIGTKKRHRAGSSYINKITREEDEEKE